MLVWQFFNIPYISGSMKKCRTNSSKNCFFLNQEDKFLILVKSGDQICPIVFHLFKTLYPRLDKHNILKCCSGVFPYTLIYGVMFEIFGTTFQHFKAWLFSNPGDVIIIYFFFSFYKAWISFPILPIGF